MERWEEEGGGGLETCGWPRVGGRFGGLSQLFTATVMRTRRTCGWVGGLGGRGGGWDGRGGRTTTASHPRARSPPPRPTGPHLEQARRQHAPCVMKGTELGNAIELLAVCLFSTLTGPHLEQARRQYAPAAGPQVQNPPPPAAAGRRR